MAITPLNPDSDLNLPSTPTPLLLHLLILIHNFHQPPLLKPPHISQYQPQNKLD